MPLISWDDTQLPAPTDSSLLVWEEMELRVHDTVFPMPPSSIGELSVGDLAILDAWFAAEAPEGTEECR